MPQSNTPVTNVAGNDVRCNVGGTRGVSGKCAVKAGSTVTVEMHQVQLLFFFIGEINFVRLMCTIIATWRPILQE